jgi:hypothetical protein
LWDTVNRFDVWEFANLLQLLTGVCELHKRLVEADGGAINPSFEVATLELLGQTRRYCKSVAFYSCEERVESAIAYIKSGVAGIAQANVSLLNAELCHARDELLKEVRGRDFVLLSADRAAFVDKVHLFGERVYDSFPSARLDIRAAGNCLAAECPTAGVFHLMRAAEHGLRSLARDRRSELPRRTALDLATWEEIIRQLEAAESAIQNYPKTLAREAQFDFYHGAMMEFKRFKNKFRNSIMHTRDTYDRDEAHRAFVHVRDFMKTLASRISERKRTPVIWKGRKWTTPEP